jgi:hypothetical protein
MTLIASLYFQKIYSQNDFPSICSPTFHLKKYLIFQLLLISASLKSEGFIAGTKVWAYKNNAPMLASIEDLQPGDFCFSQELESGKIESVKIIEVFKKKIATVTLKLLSLKNLEKAQDLTGLLAETITMSTDHKLFVPTVVDRKLVGEWTTASEIKAGTLLMFGGADSVFLQDILVLVSQADISSEEEVYCLSLAKNHNYFVSELGIIVHNFVPLFVGLSFAFGGG